MIPSELVDEASLIEAIAEAKQVGRRVYLCGNGGSAANALHIANDLFSAGVRAHALTADVSTFTAVANDFGYYKVFSRQLEVFAEADDVLICLSGSGRSPNIQFAMETGEKFGMRCFLVSDYLTKSTMQQSEEYQVALGHRLMKAIR